MQTTPIILFVIIIFFIGCKKNPAEDRSKYNKFYCSGNSSNHMDTVRSKIAGTYEWVFSRFVVKNADPEIWTPVNKGYSQKYIFDNTGLAKYFKNDTLQWTYNYVVDYYFKVSTYPTDSATLIIFFDRDTGKRTFQFLPSLCNDSALFVNPFVSHPVQNYYRKVN